MQGRTSQMWSGLLCVEWCDHKSLTSPKSDHYCLQKADGLVVELHHSMVVIGLRGHSGQGNPW